MLIAFIHSGKAFLPGISAYQDYFHKRGIETVVLGPSQHSARTPTVEWHFMGMNFKRRFKSSFLIHEFASASVQPIAGIKNRLKKSLSATPDYRIFLNQYVKDQFNFNDQVPYGFRDVGVDPNFELNSNPATKEFDYIFAGSISPDMDFEKLLDLFAGGAFKQRSLLVLSGNYQPLKKKYSRHTNIQFVGPVPKNEVTEYIHKSKYGINIKPLITPYDQQTSSKILEYSAAGIPVITSPTSWARKFAHEHGGKFYYLPEDISVLQVETVEEFDYSIPELNGWDWESQIEKSGILKFLSLKG